MALFCCQSPDCLTTFKLHASLTRCQMLMLVLETTLAPWGIAVLSRERGMRKVYDKVMQGGAIWLCTFPEVSLPVDEDPQKGKNAAVHLGSAIHSLHKEEGEVRSGEGGGGGGGGQVKRRWMSSRGQLLEFPHATAAASPLSPDLAWADLPGTCTLQGCLQHFLLRHFGHTCHAPHRCRGRTELISSGAPLLK